jgi:hypothetical protein
MLGKRGLASWGFVGLLVSASTGCQDRDLGECNLTGMTEAGGVIPGPAALDLAYRATDGLPMYEGQALVQASCGNGSFCHTPNAEGSNRIGVPKGLDFDVALACTDPTVDSTCANLQPCGGQTDTEYCQRLKRLRDNQNTTASWGERMISEIRNGTMPPGDAGQAVLDRTPWFREDGSSLPEFGTNEATDIVRNWLACSAPVVARSEVAPTADLELTECDSLDGEVCIYNGPQGALPDPTWSSIYSSVIFTQCVVCHGPPGCMDCDQNPDNPSGDIPGGASAEALEVLNLTGAETTDTSNWASESHAALVNVSASPLGECAAQGINVIPNDSTGSLMIQKMRDVQTCGGEMPLGTGTQTIPNPVIDVIEQWINAGAPNN